MTKPEPTACAISGGEGFNPGDYGLADLISEYHDEASLLMEPTQNRVSALRVEMAITFDGGSDDLYREEDV